MSLLGRKEEEEKRWKEEILPYENNLASDFSDLSSYIKQNQANSSYTLSSTYERKDEEEEDSEDGGLSLHL